MAQEQMEKQFVRDGEIIFHTCKNMALYILARVNTPLIIHELFIYSLALNGCSYHSLVFPGQQRHWMCKAGSVL